MRFLTKYFKWNGGKNEHILMELESIYTFMKKQSGQMTLFKIQELEQ